MNLPDDTPTLPLFESDAEVASPKPVRRRRTPKAAVTDDDTSSSVEVQSVEPVQSVIAEVGEAPKSATRRRRAPAVAKTDEVQATESAPPLQAPEAPALVAPVVSVEEAKTETLPSSQALPYVPHDEPRPSVNSQQDADGSSHPRNRRRGRKDWPSREPINQGSVVTRLNDDGTPAPPVSAQAVERFAQVLAGDFDMEPVAAETLEQPQDAESTAADESPEAATKRVLQAEADAPKLHKVLAQAGVGSRRDMEAMILDGQITVNGEAAHIGQRISFGDHIKVKGKPIRVRIVPPAPRILAYHKPVGEVVTHDDPEHRPTVFRRLPRLEQGKWQSVGRLDLNTEGLLLFTNSGDLANQLMHPRFGVEREYAVRVMGTLSAESKAKLLAGVSVEGQPASFQSIEDGGGEGVNHWYRVVITEGRNREVRKLFDTVGLTVSRLMRIRYGTVVLPRGLKRGVWVDLDDADVRIIRQLAGGNDRSREQEQPRQEGRGQPQDRGPMNGRNSNHNDRQGPRHQNNPQNRQNQPRGPVRNDRNDRGGPRGDRAQAGYNQQAHAAPARDFEGDEDLDFDPSKIPNPLEQTFDKRFVQRPRSPAGGAGFGRGGGGFGAGGSAPPRHQGGNQNGGGSREPDPLQTSMGYLGADAYHGRKGGGGGGRGGNRGGGGFGRGGNGGGGGGGGGFGGGGGRRGR
jgi:23S rRNA pseudouridine2605 synthase